MKLHEVSGLRFEDETMVVTIDGHERRFPLAQVSARLLKASDSERSLYEVSPSGYGIHWPLIDEDLSIDGLLGIRHLPTKSGIAA